MFNKPFVVLDLETSGIDQKKDDIIEAAMIRYEDGKEVMRYDDLIKVGYKLPKIITFITGITDKDLEENGREKDVVFKEIGKVLKGAYVVAHNVNFDAGFLKAKGIKMDVEGYIDTVILSQIMMPEMASYSLEALTEDLGITHVNKHRAMDDTEATLDLFKYLCGKMEALPKSVLDEIAEMTERSDWDGFPIDRHSDMPQAGKNFQRSAQDSVRSFAVAQDDRKGVRDDIQENGIGGVRRPLEPKDILGEGGVLGGFWEDYEPREQQIQMSEAILGAFEEGYHLICEAPTGVGKSLAYLTSAAKVAIENKSKVVISTNTINLQQQLFEKDVPLLQRIYKEGTNNVGIRAAMLKGRSHYLCLRRLAKFKEKSRFSETEIVLLVKILVWQAITKTDDCGEIYITRNESLIWDFELCSDSKYCTPKNCRPYGECYLHRARKQAEMADIIIVNHALLCADLESEGALLPEYNYLVVDEAHNFEEAATGAFGMRLKQENLSLPVKTIGNILEEIKKRYGGTLFAGQIVMDKIDDVQDEIQNIQNSIDNLFSVIAFFVNRNVQKSTYEESLLIDKIVQGMEEWVNLGVSADDTCMKVKRWLKSLKDFNEAMLLEGSDNSEQGEFVTDLMQEAEIVHEQLAALGDFFADIEQGEYIRWFTSDQSGNVAVNLAPYLPGDYLKERLYNKKKSIVFTSATLGVKLTEHGFDAKEQHPFTYIRTILNLDGRFEEVIIDSPFDFETQAYVIAPTDAIPVTSFKSTDQFIPFFEELIKKVKGGMLSLFTSYRMIETLYMALAESLQNEGVRLLAQRISGGRNKIMKAYMGDPRHSVLFGTSSFWEGVDIKGDALTTLVIHKLPFDVPSDPIHKARGQMFGNGFMEYSVPRAILKFRQGFGRLIRSKKDYGVMIVLDNRVLTKEYGKMFLDALPDNIAMDNIGLMEAPDIAGEWLDLMRSRD